MSTKRARTGRPAHGTRRHFIDATKDTVKCRRCEKMFSAKNVRTLRDHLSDHHLHDLTPRELEAAGVSVIYMRESEWFTQAELDRARWKNNITIDKFVNKKPTATQSKQVNQAILKLFVECGVAFSAADSDAFKELVETLRPGFVSPSRQRLSTVELDYANEEAIELTRPLLEAAPGFAVANDCRPSDFHRRSIRRRCSCAEDERAKESHSGKAHHREDCCTTWR